MGPQIDQVVPKASQKYPGRSLFRGPETDQRPRRPPERHQGSFWMTFYAFRDPLGPILDAFVASDESLFLQYPAFYL